MNTTVTSEAEDQAVDPMPGAQMAMLRMEKGLSVEHIAVSLNLRVQMIQLLEADDYARLPEPVFIKGYLRAYAKLLNVEPIAYIEAFDKFHCNDMVFQRPLWRQSPRPVNKAENTVRWVVVVFSFIVSVAVALWWSKTKDVDVLFANALNHAKQDVSSVETEIRLTDLSKMRSLLSSTASSMHQPSGQISTVVPILSSAG
jgi:cytoskeleton protein RodZ